MLPPRVALIAEDEVLVLLDVEDAIRALGFDQIVSLATRGRVLEWLVAHTPAVAVIDYRLVDGTSEPIAEALLAKRIPTVVYSGNEYQEDTHQVFRSFTWIKKPASQEALSQAIAAALAR